MSILIQLFLLFGLLQVSYAQKKSVKELLLTNQGGDRATAYTMSNKILVIEEGILCTWIDKHRQNRWSLVDHETDKILVAGKIGGIMPDNHCGAALARSPNGDIHAVIGGHHSNLYHYSISDVKNGEWVLVDSIVTKGTYPALIADSQANLYLTFRHQQEKFWTLDLAKFERGRWSPPKTIVEASKPGYVYWTNSLTVGKDDAVHLLFANVQTDPKGFEKGSLYHGASHLVSADGGETWSSFPGIIVDTPVKARAVPLVEGSYQPHRIATPAFLEKYAPVGPTSKEYAQIHLSNIVTDTKGIPYFLYHNGFEGTVALMRYENGWTSTDLKTMLAKNYPGYRVHVQSTLTITETGKLYTGLMLEPTQINQWGAPGTSTVVLTIDPTSSKTKEVFSTPIDPEIAQWLPAFVHPQQAVPKAPFMIYTEGVNAGGFQNNHNEVATKVKLIKFDSDE